MEDRKGGYNKWFRAMTVTTIEHDEESWKARDCFNRQPSGPSSHLSFSAATTTLHPLSRLALSPTSVLSVPQDEPRFVLLRREDIKCKFDGWSKVEAPLALAYGPSSNFAFSL